MGTKMNFNRRSIEALRTPLNRPRHEFRDEREPGLYLYVTSAGTKTFYLYRKFRGHPWAIKLGRYPDLSVAAARELARQQKGLLARGIDPKAQAREEKRTCLSYAQAYDEYVSAKGERLKPGSLKAYRHASNALADWKDRAMTSITKEDVVAMHRKLTRDRGANMADLVFRHFQAVFSFFSHKFDYDGANPVKTLSANGLWNKRQGSNRRKTIITDKDLGRWYQTVQAWHDQTERDYVTLIFLTGMRRDEAARICWRDVDFEAGVLTAYVTKNSKPLVLPMSNALRVLLEVRSRSAGDSPFVFPGRRDAKKPFNPGATASKISDASGVAFTLHDLRRKFITIGNEDLNLSPYTVKRLVNHTVGGSDVTGGYVVHDIERLRTAAEQIANRLLELAGCVRETWPDGQERLSPDIVMSHASAGCL